MFWSKLSSLAVLTALALASHTASAQQMGREGYNFPARAPSMSAQFDFQERMQNSSSSSATSAGGMGALNQYITQYNSSSTAIANMNQVNQTVTGGTATATVTADQSSNGNQDASASTKTTIDNSVTRNQSHSHAQP